MAPSRTWIEISKKALAQNVAAVRNLLGSKTQLLAVVKSNAYGHGLIACAREFVGAGVEWLGVFSIEEGVALRDSGVVLPILVLGPTDSSFFSEADRRDIKLTVHNAENLKLLNQNQSVHLMIDTGLSRDGILWEDVSRAASSFDAGRIGGICSHLADGENISDNSYSKVQQDRFDKVSADLERRGLRHPIRHLVATDGLFMFPEMHYDMVRAGLALYGQWPTKEFKSRFGDVTALKPALSWFATIELIKNISKGVAIGYSCTEIASSEMKIALLPVGYYDGYPWSLSSKGFVLIHGTKARIVGRVSMNMMVVDVTQISDVKRGDTAVLIGGDDKNRIEAGELGDGANHFVYEILTNINSSIPRAYV